MKYNFEKSALDFFELASEQRLAILQKILLEKSKLSEITKELDSTAPEVFRNLQRLEKAGILAKDADGYYHLTTYGNSICSLIPSLIFISQNKMYFKDHNFGEIPQKFIQRVGALVSGNYIHGITKVLEKWHEIIDHAEQYVSGVLVEEPLDLIEPLIKKAKNGIKVNSVFSESAIVPDGRSKIVNRLGLQSLIQNGTIERKMKKDVKVAVFFNEKEACVMFPTTKDEPDISKMFFGNEPMFHEWCLDYFRYLWYGSESFQESKLK